MIEYDSLTLSLRSCLLPRKLYDTVYVVFRLHLVSIFIIDDQTNPKRLSCAVDRTTDFHTRGTTYESHSLSWDTILQQPRRCVCSLALDYRGCAKVPPAYQILALPLISSHCLRPSCLELSILASLHKAPQKNLRFAILAMLDRLLERMAVSAWYRPAVVSISVASAMIV
jgi:hypothetical protein